MSTLIVLKETRPLFRFEYRISHLHLIIFKISLNIIKTLFTFLLISIILFYPDKFRTNFNNFNYFNHLKSISTNFTEIIIIYIAKLLGCFIFYLNKFENYFIYLENSIASMQSK